MKFAFGFLAPHMLCLISFIATGQVSSVGPILNPEQGLINCVYKITFQPDSTVKDVRVEYSRLLIGKNISKFETVGTQVGDSIRNSYPEILTASNTNPQEYADKMLSAPYTRFHYSIYKTIAINRLYCYDKVGNVLYRYIEPDKLFTWKISQEKTNIAGYACQRATTEFAGRVFEAWFTREVPISEGPYKFYGLPGLIVKVHDSDNYYSFELTKLSKTIGSVPVALPAKKAIITTKEALRKGQATYNLSLANRATQMGGGVSAAQLQRMKKPITPLELR